MNISETEENYLKAIYKILEQDPAKSAANTNAIATAMNTSAASVTDMLKRLAEKNYILYEKYKGVKLTETGDKWAKTLIRKHRLWETFLVQQLNYAWHEVHDLAEQLEHIQSADLINRLDAFLKFPRFDPHGDPIPDAEGNYTFRQQVLLSTLLPFESGIIVGVAEHSTSFLQYLDKQQLTLGVK